MNVKVITNEKYGKGNFASGAVGSAVIRGKWLVEAWEEASEWRNGDMADAIIFQKAYWKQMMQDFPGRKILDLCDPDWMDGTLKLVDLANLCDAVTCSNDGITEFVSKVVKDRPIVTVPDRLNLDYFTRKKTHTGKALRAVYFGYQHNAAAVLPQVLRSLARFGLELIVISNRPFTAYQSYGVPIKFVKWNQATAYDDIMFGDIALNPPLMQSNFRYKSNNKTLVAWGLGLPVVNEANDLERFMDPVERTKEAELRWQEIKEKWDIKFSVKQFQDLLNQVSTK